MLNLIAIALLQIATLAEPPVTTTSPAAPTITAQPTVDGGSGGWGSDKPSGDTGIDGGSGGWGSDKPTGSTGTDGGSGGWGSDAR